MNSVSRTLLNWHHYKSAGHPCSLACLIMICSLLDVTHKKQMTKWLLLLSWKVTSVCIKMLNIQTMCSRIFGGKTRKTTKACCSLWAGEVGFCSCSLFMFLTGDVVSAMKWRQLKESPPSPQAFITSSSLYKWHIWFPSLPRRGWCFWYLHHQGMKFRHLFW